MASPKLTYKPVTLKNWDDMTKLFESKGAPQYCWCMVWRDMKDNASRSDKSAKKASLKNYVSKKIPIGLLCYQGKEPIAWCSVAPRESYRELSGDNSLDDVWSLVCFYIKKEFRKQHITSSLIDAAIKYARRKGAKYVEAYPVNPNSPSYRFMGFKSTFDEAGFSFSHKVGQRRNVMTIKV
jgi:GNAT superfamily N-acetyltransferase